MVKILVNVMCVANGEYYFAFAGMHDLTDEWKSSRSSMGCKDGRQVYFARCLFYHFTIYCTSVFCGAKWPIADCTYTVGNTDNFQVNISHNDWYLASVARQSPYQIIWLATPTSLPKCVFDHGVIPKNCVL